MKVLLILFAVFSFSHCLVIKQHAHKHASLRAQLIKEGKLADFLEQHHFAVAKGEIKGSRTAVAIQPFVDYFDGYYTGEIQLGTPYQNFTVLLDTYSADLWVIDARCNSDACKGSGYTKNKFNTAASSTFSTTNQPFVTSPNTGSVASGYVATDVLNLAGLVAKSQGMGVASTVASFFGQQPADGTLGLGWPGLSDIDTPPPIQNLLDQMDKPIFTMWLNPAASPQEQTENGGIVTYGALDTEHCAAQVDYVTLSSLSYWQFPMNGFKFGTYSSSTRQEAILDSSASWFGGPASAVAAIASGTGAKYDSVNYMYTLPCAGKYPEMQFTIGGKQFFIPSSEYILDLGLGKGTCALALFEVMGGGFFPEWILGNTWMRSYCNVHDVGQRRVGFARNLAAN